MIRDIELKILDEKASVPYYATEDSAGVDLIACISNIVDIAPLETKLINTGISINMQTVPENCMAIIVPRSGKGHKEGKILGNSIGIIDRDYQGELMVSVLNRNKDIYIKIEPNERIAQLIFMPIIRTNFKLVNTFNNSTLRGSGGFGSTG